MNVLGLIAAPALGGGILALLATGLRKEWRRGRKAALATIVLLLAAVLGLERGAFWLGRPEAFLIASAGLALPLAVVARSRSRMLMAVSAASAAFLFGIAGYLALDRFVRGGLPEARIGRDHPVALVEAWPTVLEKPFQRKRRYSNSQFVAGSPAVGLRIYLQSETGFGPPRELVLPGEEWGIGGQKYDIQDAWSIFGGRRSYHVLTSLKVQYYDNEESNTGENLGPFDPWELRRRFERQLPLLRKNVGSFFGCNVSTFKQMVYVPASAGRLWGVYFTDTGGFYPLEIRPEKFRALIPPPSSL